MLFKELESNYFFCQISSVGTDRWSFGLNLSYEKLDRKEFYILVNLAIWQISLGFKI